MFTTTYLTAAALALFSATTINALGCYNDDGLPFNELHGNSADSDLTGEVFQDINTQCITLDKAVFKAGSAPWTHCTEWTITQTPDTSCYDDCADGCAATASSGGRGGDFSAALCGSGCDAGCYGGSVGEKNHILWTVKYEGADAEATFSYDMCNKAFQTEVGGCSRGSEQSHEGFWYRIDPQGGPCPA